MDVFFTVLYQTLAEPMAEEEQVVWELEKKNNAARLCDWVLANRGNPAAVASAGGLDRRLLPHMSMQDLYDLFVEH